MSELLRSLLYPYLAQATDDAGTNAPAGGGKVDGAPPAEGGDGEDGDDDHEIIDEGGKQEKQLTPAELDAGMAAAIGAGLKEKADGAPAAGTKKDGKAATPAGDKKAKTPEEIKAETDAAAKAAETKAAAEAEAAAKAKAAEDAKLKGKRADDFQLTAEEKKALGQKAQERFHELHRIAKGHEDTIDKHVATIKQITEARDEFMAVLDEHKVDSKDLLPLLSYNLAIKDGKFEDALKIVEEQRAMLLTQLGREGPGVDLLKDFPDLAARVEKMELKREDALELAQTRRRDAARQQQDQQRGQQQQTVEQATKEREAALGEIDKWCAALLKSDIDYKPKEARIMKARGDKPSVMQEIIKDYPPRLWLKAFQHVYDSIEIAKTLPAAGARSEPLRPNGAKGGAKEPASIAEAVAQGLGYDNLDLRQ